MTCPRCGGEAWSSTCSMFTTEDICSACAEDERAAPNYAEAKRVESEACVRGDFNFPGIGLAPADVAFLTARRRARGAA